MSNSISGKVLNPKTNRYIKKTSRKGQALTRQCIDGYSKNPATNRCKKDCPVGSSRTSISKNCRKIKECKEGFSRNTDTKRCKKNILPKILFGTIRQFKTTYNANTNRWNILDKIYNGNTNRWVNLESKLGRTIQEDSYDPPDEYPREYYY